MTSLSLATPTAKMAVKKMFKTASASVNDQNIKSSVEKSNENFDGQSLKSQNGVLFKKTSDSLSVTNMQLSNLRMNEISDFSFQVKFLNENLLKKERIIIRLFAQTFPSSESIFRLYYYYQP